MLRARRGRRARGVRARLLGSCLVVLVVVSMGVVVAGCRAFRLRSEVALVVAAVVVAGGDACGRCGRGAVRGRMCSWAGFGTGRGMFVLPFDVTGRVVARLLGGLRVGVDSWGTGEFQVVVE